MVNKWTKQNCQIKEIIKDHEHFKCNNFKTQTRKKEEKKREK